MEQKFDSPDLAAWLAEQPVGQLDELDFGLVSLTPEGKVVAYNRALSILTGVTNEQAMGKHFFTEVAPCTNNFMVAEKYQEPTLDQTMPYMFTYVTTPTKVRLRLIKDQEGNAYMLAVKD